MSSTTLPLNPLLSDPLFLAKCSDFPDRDPVRNITRPNHSVENEYICRLCGHDISICFCDLQELMDTYGNIETCDSDDDCATCSRIGTDSYNAREFLGHIFESDDSDDEPDQICSETESLPYNPPSPIDLNIYNDYWDVDSVLCKNIVYPNKITKKNKNLIHRVGEFLKQAFSFSRSKVTTANKVTQTYSSDKESLISFRKGLVINNELQMNSKFSSKKPKIHSKNQGLYTMICNLEKKLQKHRDILIKKERDDKLEKFKTVPQMWPAMATKVQLDDNISDLLGDLIASLKEGVQVKHTIGLDSNVNSVYADLSKVTEEMKNTFMKTAKTADSYNAHTMFGLISLLGSGIYCMVKRDTTSTVVLVLSVIYNFLNTTGFSKLLSTSFLKSVITLVQSVFKAENEPQMSSTLHEGLVSAVLVMITTYMSIGKDVTTCVSSVMKAIMCFDRTKASVESFITFAMNVVETLINLVVVNIFGGDTVHILKSRYNEVNDFISEYTKLTDAIRKHEFVYNVSSAEKVNSLLCANECLIKSIPNNKETSGLCTMLRNYRAELKKLLDTLTSMNLHLDGIKTEPVCILFRGPPGVGKSNHIMYFCNRLLPMLAAESNITIDPATASSYIYNCLPENVYWDGYNNWKLIAILDDFGQIRDVAGNPDNEFMKLIRAVNVFEYNLHMADIKDKGNTRFNAKVVICTTNLQNFNIESIVDTEAVKRRFTFTFDVAPKIEYCTDESRGGNPWARRLDPSKLPKGSICETDLSPDTAEYFEFNIMKNCYTGRVMTYDEVTYEVQTKVKANKARHQQYIENLNIALKRGYKDMEPPIASKPSEATSQGLPSVKVLLAAIQGTNDIQMSDVQMRFDKLRTEPMVTEQPKSGCRVYDMFYAHVDAPYLLNTCQSYCDANGYRNLFDLMCHLDVAYEEIKECLDDDAAEVINLFNGVHEKYDILTLLANRPLVVKDYVIRPISMLQCLWMEIVAGMNAIYEKSGMKWFISDFLDEQFYQIKEFILKYPILKYMSILAGITAGGAMVRSFINGIFKYFFNIDIIPQGASGNQGRGKSRSSNRKVRTRIGKTKAMKNEANVEQAMIMQKPPKAMYGEPQLAIKDDPANVSIIGKVVSGNCYELHLPIDLEGTYQKAGYLTFITGRIALVPNHFIHYIAAISEDEPSFLEMDAKLFKSCSGIMITFKIKDFLGGVELIKSDSLDLALFEVSNKSVPIHSDITKFFCTQEHVSKYDQLAFRLVKPGPKVIENWCGLTRKHPGVMICSTHDDDYILNDAWIYTAETVVGDCGALFTVIDRQSASMKIVGIHVSGNPYYGVGFACTITQEIIKDCLKTLKPQFVGAPMNEKGDPLPLGVVQEQFGLGYKSEFKRNPYGKSKIGPSPLHGVFGPPTEVPARLTPFMLDGVRVDPLAKARETYCVEHVSFDQQLIEAAGDHYFDTVNQRSVTKFKSIILSFEEAILGTDRLTDFGSISRQTSSGFFPLTANVKNLGKGKSYFFGKGEEYDLTNSNCLALRLRVEEIIIRASRGERLEHIYQDCLKDETRSLEKVRIGKTRLFSSGPLDLLICFRMYFGAIISWFQENRIHNGSGVGINPYSDDWTILAKYLLRFGGIKLRNMGAGDFKGFDGSGRPPIYYEILAKINRWYNDGPVNAKIRETLWSEIVNSIHISEDNVYVWYYSLPSGAALTTFVNIFYNQISVRMCWMFEHKDEIKSLQLFNDNVEYQAYGDDNNFSVSEPYMTRFNEHALSIHMARIGLKYTSEDKGAAKNEMRGLTEISYLQRGFRHEPIFDRYVAPLNLQTVKEMNYWYRDSSSAYNNIAQVVQTSLREMSLHGREVFEELAPILLAKFAETDLTPVSITTYLRNLLSTKDLIEYY